MLSTINNKLRHKMFLILLIIFIGNSFRSLAAQDCNKNDIVDSIDIQSGNSQDCNQDGIPDECLFHELKFNAPIRLTTNERAYRLEHGDFDSDGNLDFISCAPLVGCDLFLGNGKGAFKRGEYIESGLNYAVRIQDLNSDGNLDYIASNDKGLVVKLGLGDGTFEENQQHSVPDKGPEFGLEIADFNNDQILDAVVPGLNSDQGDSRSFAVFLGIGDGSFQNPSIMNTPFRFRLLGSIDINMDGNTDIISTGQSQAGQRYGDSIAVLFGNGDGTFDPPQTFPLQNTGLVSAVSFADFNKDGLVDVSCVVFTSGANPRVAIYINNDEGVIQNTRTYYLEKESDFFQNITVTDFDLDGNLDLALGTDRSAQFSIPILYGRNDGTFEDATYLVSPGIIRLNSVDVNHDELPDLIGTDDGRAIIIQNFGNRAFGNVVTYLIPNFPRHFSMGDIDDDQIQDIVIAHLGSSRVSIHLGTSGGKFLEPTRFRVGGEPTEVILSKLNDDAFSDIAVIDPETDTIKIFYGDDDAHFEAGPVIDIDRSAFTLKSEDIDNDGNQDLIYVNRFEPRILLLFNRGRFGFEPQRQINTPQDVAMDLEFADLDSDGIKDLIYAGNRGIMRMKGLGSGLFDTPRLINFPSNRLNQIELADFNQDGILDFLVGDGDDDDHTTEVLVALSEGDQFNIERIFQDERGDLTGLNVEDFNSDGVPDFAVAQSSSQLSVFLTTSKPQVFSTPIRYSAGAGIIGVESADIDNDGDNDLLTVSRGDPAINWVRNEGLPVLDCDRNGSIDSCDIRTIPELDCNKNGILDSCERQQGGDKVDIDNNGELDVCQTDCNQDDIPDSYQIELEPDLDCNNNGRLDSCEIADGIEDDCNLNGKLDSCELILHGEDLDSNQNEVLDECESGMQVLGDANQDGRLDISDSVWLLIYLFVGTSESPPCSDLEELSESGLTVLDWQGDGLMDLTDAIEILRFEFQNGPSHVLLPPGSDKNKCIDVIGCSDNLNCEMN